MNKVQRYEYNLTVTEEIMGTWVNSWEWSGHVYAHCKEDAALTALNLATAQVYNESPRDLNIHEYYTGNFYKKTLLIDGEDARNILEFDAPDLA